MSFSIGQVEREDGEYMEIVKTEVRIPDESNKFVEIKYACKSALYEGYHQVLKTINDIYVRFKEDEKMEWIRFKDKKPDRRKYKEILTLEVIEHISTKKKIPIICIEETSSIYEYKNAFLSDGGAQNLTHWMPVPALPEAYLSSR